MLDTLFERGGRWIVRTRVPVSRFTDKEVDQLGLDPEAEEAFDSSPAVIDLGALAPLRYIRPGNRHANSTMFLSDDGDSYIVLCAFEAFIAEYLAWLERPVVEAEDDG